MLMTSYQIATSNEGSGIDNNGKIDSQRRQLVIKFLFVLDTKITSRNDGNLSACFVCLEIQKYLLAKTDSSQQTDNFSLLPGAI